LRTKVNMLSSNQHVHLRKTLSPTITVLKVSPCFVKQGWRGAANGF
jgi:hypothetical protein